METGLIKDGQITASSQWGTHFAAIQGRLNFKGGKQKSGQWKSGGWCARRNDANQWIQVALGSYTKLTSIATQGRNDYNQWVTKYKLQYSDDGVNFHYYKTPGQSSPKVKPYSFDASFIHYWNILLNSAVFKNMITVKPRYFDLAFSPSV